MSVKWSKLSRTKISWQWFLPQGCWRLQIKGTEKHFRKLKSFTSPAWTRVSVLFHRFSYSKPAVQKNQRPVKQNPVNICLIHVALLENSSSDGWRCLGISLKLNISIWDVERMGVGYPPLVWMQSLFLQKAQTCPSSSFPKQSSPNQHWSHRSVFIPFLKTHIEWFHATSYFSLGHIQ